MLNRLLTSVAIISMALALTAAALWWRSDRGHSDTFHLGANSATQTVITTLPGGRVSVHVAKADTVKIGTTTYYYPLKQVFGYCLFVPGLWFAVRVRRRLMPRPPGSELPAVRSAR